MSEIFPNEGLTMILDVLPRIASTNASMGTQTFMGLFASGGGSPNASTVPVSNAVLSNSATPNVASGVVELISTGGYARIPVGSANWGAAVSSGTGMRSSIASPGMSFAESTGAYASSINGFFLAGPSNASINQSTGGASVGSAFFFANFNDQLPITVNASGFTIRVAPFWHYDQ